MDTILCDAVFQQLWLTTVIPALLICLQESHQLYTCIWKPCDLQFWFQMECPEFNQQNAKIFKLNLSILVCSCERWYQIVFGRVSNDGLVYFTLSVPVRHCSLTHAVSGSIPVMVRILIKTFFPGNFFSIFFRHAF